MSQPYTGELETAITAVRAAARLCVDVAERITAQAIEKADRSPVTVADFGSQAIICQALGRTFADDPVIAEEDSTLLRQADHAEALERVVEYVGRVVGPVDAGQVCRWIDRGGQAEYCKRFWTLDPIDGTKGFLRGGQYAIALALIEEGQVVVAALGCPNLPVDPANPTINGALFTAVAGQGAHVRPLFGEDEPERIAVAQTAQASAGRFCESIESSHSSHDDAGRIAALLGIAAEPLRMDSQCKYATVARGQAEIYLRLPTRRNYVEKIWDHAAGALVVEQAGGTVTDVAGRPLDFTHGRRLETNRGAIITNGRLHEAVLAAVQQTGVR